MKTAKYLKEFTMTSEDGDGLVQLRLYPSGKLKGKISVDGEDIAETETNIKDFQIDCQMMLDEAKKSGMELATQVWAYAKLDEEGDWIEITEEEYDKL